MTVFLDKLPTILVLAVLVGVFLSLRKHAPSARIRLWTYAWALIFLHFFIQAFETHTGILEQIIESIDIGALELSGIVFAVSMMRDVENRNSRRALLAVLGIPTAFHAIAATFDWNIHICGRSAGHHFLRRRGSRCCFYPMNPVLNIGLAAALAVSGICSIHDQLLGSPDFGINAILSLTSSSAAFSFWQRYPRSSPGVIVVAGGFFAWGAVFPAGTLLGSLLRAWQLNPELWNVPKFFVAFGMVLALLEDKSCIIERAIEREHAGKSPAATFADHVAPACRQRSRRAVRRNRRRRHRRHQLPARRDVSRHRRPLDASRPAHGLYTEAATNPRSSSRSTVDHRKSRICATKDSAGK